MANAPIAARPRVGVVKFASCDGCQLTLLDLEDELLEVAGGLEDPQAGLDDLAVFHPQAKRAFALDAGELVDFVDALVHDLLRCRSAAHALPPRGAGWAAVVALWPVRVPPSSVTMLRNGSE